jgi:hypothetical protein
MFVIERSSHSRFLSIKIIKVFIGGGGVSVDTSNVCTDVVENCEPHNRYIKFIENSNFILMHFTKYLSVIVINNVRRI